VGNHGSALAGTNYGSYTLNDLLGGSGAGGGVSSAGGGGGGAIQMSAAGTITIGTAGLLSARGGDVDFRAMPRTDGGGGGSGGAILLAARTIELLGTTNVTVSGGSALHDTEPLDSGGGGGGRVAFYADDAWQAYNYPAGNLYTNHPPQVAIEGGNGYNNGERGTFYAGDVPAWTQVRGAVIIVR
jgi:hypothetical protein